MERVFCSVIFLLSLMVLAKSDIVFDCPEGWTRNGTSTTGTACFKFETKDKKTPAIAESTCAKTPDAHLTSVKSKAENDWIYSNRPDTTLSYYIGHDSHDAKRIKWTDGSTGNFKITIDLNQTFNCLQLGADGNWKTPANCSHPEPYICEKAASKLSNCVEGQFVCSNNGMCVNATKLCDGINDCRDLSDEQHCGATSSSTTGYVVGLGVLVGIVFLLTVATAFMFGKIRELRRFENIQGIPVQADREPNVYDDPREIMELRKNRGGASGQAQGGGGAYGRPQARLARLMSKKNSKKKDQTQSREDEALYENQMTTAEHNSAEDDGTYANHQLQQQEEMYANRQGFK